MGHLLVTNDFPPKVGGIQSYLWELWRRLPPGEATVLAPRHPDAARFDAAQPFRIERTSQPVLLPTPALRRHIDRLAGAVDARLVVLDPALPLGLLGPHLDRPYAVVLHGAEVTVPARLPVASAALSRVVTGATWVIAAGGYPAAEAARVAGTAMPATTLVPPGVDCDRFRPLSEAGRAQARSVLGVPGDARLVVSVSRLVPRKGMDVLIAAAARLAESFPRLMVVIAGAGRDRRRLERRIDRSGAPVILLGRVTEERLPPLYGCADAFVMLCRTRWWGLEQEGFGIVFLEAAACGVPQVAGRSGGAPEAVVHGMTGVVVDDPTDVAESARAIAVLLGDDATATVMGRAARLRAEEEFSYDKLAARLAEAIDGASTA